MLRSIVFLAACATIAASVMATGATAAPVQPMPAHQAFDAVPQQPDGGCSSRSRLLSHASYLRVDAERPLRCSEPLSTDTLMKAHRWDRT